MTPHYEKLQDEKPSFGSACSFKQLHTLRLRF